LHNYIEPKTLIKSEFLNNFSAQSLSSFIAFLNPVSKTVYNGRSKETATITSAIVIYPPTSHPYPSIKA
jgi:hypothetical protein